ncbi:MAG: hypothetical protein IOC58_09385, partial [Methylobacterium sp.]|nr:hypothetical protein [Methylobacterium sp.]
MSSKSSPALDLFGQLEKAAQDMVREAKRAPKPAKVPVASPGREPPVPASAAGGGNSGGKAPAPPPPPTAHLPASPPPAPPSSGGYDGSSIEVLEGL